MSSPTESCNEIFQPELKRKLKQNNCIREETSQSKTKKTNSKYGQDTWSYK